MNPDDYLILYEAAIDQGADAAPEPVDTAPDPGQDVPPEQPTEPPLEQAAPVPEWEQYGFKDTEQLWRSFREAQNYIATTRAQRAQEPEPDPGPQMPPLSFGSNASEEELDNLHNYAAANGVQGIIAVAKQVDQFKDWYGDEVHRYYMTHWNAVDPVGFQEARLNAWWEQRQPEIEQRIAPVAQSYQSSIVDAGAELAKQSHPDWAQYQDKIVALIASDTASRDQLFAAKSAQEAQRMFMNVCDFVAFQENRIRRMNQPVSPAAAPTNGTAPDRDEQGRFKPRTADTSTTSRVEPETEMQQTRRLIKEKMNDL